MSPLAMKLIAILRQNPKGILLTTLTSRAERPMHEVELALKSLRKAEYAREESGIWYPGEYRAASAQLAGAIVGEKVERHAAVAESFRQVPPPEHPSKRQKRCMRCDEQKSVIGFYAGDAVCRACRKKEGSGKAPGQVVDVTDRERARDTYINPPLQVLEQSEPEKPRKLPMPAAVRIAIQSLEHDQAIIERSLRLLRETFA